MASEDQIDRFEFAGISIREAIAFGSFEAAAYVGNSAISHAVDLLGGGKAKVAGK